MNRKQKTCLLAGMVVVVVMGLFPPWTLESKEVSYFPYIRKAEFRYTIKAGPYSWIGNPPQAKKANPYSEGHAEGNARFIDLYRLGLQYFVVAVVTAGLIVTLGDKKPNAIKGA